MVLQASQKLEIEKTVRSILQESDLETVTMRQIRKIASEKLNLDLNQLEYKDFVREVVDNFIEEPNVKDKGHEMDDNGHLMICKLSDKRKVTIHNFKGTTLVSIRDFYNKDGKDHPTCAGISLKEEQWVVLKKNMPAIQEAIREVKERSAIRERS